MSRTIADLKGYARRDPFITSISLIISLFIGYSFLDHGSRIKMTQRQDDRRVANLGQAGERKSGPKKREA